MRRLKPLVNSEIEKLEWKDVFEGFKMMRLRTEADGSCFFHALAKAYFKPYITGKIKDKPLNRKKFIRSLRTDLSKKLGSKVDPIDPESKTYYETLSKGELTKIAEEMPEYSLERMEKELDSNSPISNIYNEFISNQLDIDLYILDGIKRDVYMTGTDDKLLYKNRKSIVILYLPGHYELVGIMRENNYLETYFDPQDPFILRIRERMNELRS